MRIPRPQLKRPKLQRPRLKLERSRLPKIQGPKLRGPSFQPPQVVSDLYGDLKDRRLLPAVVLLFVAIVAVPIALSSSSGEPAPTAPSAAHVPADAPEAQAAVLAENPGLRDYTQRLDALKAKNPFEQQFPAAGLGETEVQSVTGGADTTTAAGGGGDLSAGTGSVDTGSSGVAVSGGSPSGSGTPSVAPTDVETKTKYFSFRVDLRYGVEGDVREVRNVKLLDFVSPVGVFLGVSENAKRALFFLSSDVASVSGAGQCAPAPTDCEFLSLAEGNAQQVTYQPPDGAPPTTYTLELVDVRVVKVKDPTTTK
jgi:hypothetical protein